MHKSFSPLICGYSIQQAKLLILTVPGLEQFHYSHGKIISIQQHRL